MGYVTVSKKLHIPGSPFPSIIKWEDWTRGSFPGLVAITSPILEWSDTSQTVMTMKLSKYILSDPHGYLFLIPSLHLPGSLNMVWRKDCSMMWLLFVPQAGPKLNRDCFLQTPLRDCPIIIDVHYDINQQPSFVSFYVLVSGTSSPDLVNCVKLTSHTW